MHTRKSVVLSIAVFLIQDPCTQTAPPGRLPDLQALQFAGTRSRLNLDIYNTLNASAVLLQNDTYGTWQTPTEILVARFVKFSVQFDF